jgi:hypothetical protein
VASVKDYGKKGKRIRTRFQSPYQPSLRVALKIVMPGLMDVDSIRNGLCIANVGSSSEQKAVHHLDWEGRRYHCLVLVLRSPFSLSLNSAGVT